jgi:DNA-binding transcriptional ArsR family regulator
MTIQNMLNIGDLPAVAPVESLQALRAVADTQRHRILALLIEEPLTAAAVAEKLRIARTRVYYHLDILKKNGFIEVRPVAAMIERTYRALARTFRVDRRMLSATTAASAIDDAQAGLLDLTAEDLRASHAAPASGVGRAAETLVARAFLRLDSGDADGLRSELGAVLAKYGARALFAGGDEYEYAVAFFPTGRASS